MNITAITLPKIGSSAFASRFLTLAAPAFAIAISLVIILFVVWPKFTEILKLRNSNAELVQRVESLKIKVEKLSILDRADLDVKLGAAEQLLPSDKSVFTLVAQIEATAATSGVLLNRVDLAPGSLKEQENKGQPRAQSSQEELAPKVQLKVAATGDYKSFEQFLNNLFTISRVVAIKDLSLTAGGGEGSAQVRGALTVDAYWMPLPKELSSVESPIEDLGDNERKILEQVQATGIISQPPARAESVGKSDLFAPF